MSLNMSAGTAPARTAPRKNSSSKAAPKAAPSSTASARAPFRAPSSQPDEPTSASAPSPHATIALLQSHSLTSVVQGELERMILSGELAPGDKLTEMALAARLGVSRGPLREAFRMLEEAGLVRTEKNRGVFVRAIPLDEAIEIFDLRAAMEELVGRRLAQHITPAQLKEIRTLVDQMEQAVKAKDAPRYHLLNLQFHDRLVALAGNGKLAAIYRKLIKELSLFRRLNLAEGGLMPASAHEHRQIVKAIASGDAQAAGKAMFDHVIDSKERTIRNNPHPSDAPAPARLRMPEKNTA